MTTAIPEPARRPRSAARTALITIVVLVVLLWIVQGIDATMHYSLLRFGIEPRVPSKLEDILSAPFLATMPDIEANTPPLVILGFIVALRGLRQFLTITMVTIVMSGLGVWLFSPTSSSTVGASGVIFGYFGYLIARSVIERRVRDVVLALMLTWLFWASLPLLLPGHAGISWQAHLFGLLGGILSAWLLHSRRPRIVPTPEVRSPYFGLDGGHTPDKS